MGCTLRGCSHWQGSQLCKPQLPPSLEREEHLKKWYLPNPPQEPQTPHRMNGLLAAAAVCVVLFGSAAGAKVENVALRGRAAMSSIVAGESAHVGYLGHAINAIDGNQNPNFYTGSCAHTAHEKSPWWRVDLLTAHKIQYVTITNTITQPQRMNGAELLIGNSLANNGNNNPRCATVSSIGAGATQTFQCDGMVGRYVNLIIRDREEYLHPCEVEVYGYPEEQACSCA